MPLREERSEIPFGIYHTTKSSFGTKPLVRRAVAVGFEPTVELPPHTLSRSATARSVQVGYVPDLRQRLIMPLGGRRRTGVNE